jgi:hypothetical protein
MKIPQHPQTVKYSVNNIPTGTRFGNLEVLDHLPIVDCGTYKVHVYRCLCHCNDHETHIKDIRASNLLTGQISCGCIQKAYPNRTDHGMRHTKLSTIWRNMKARCLNPHNPSWAHYGGRGIQVCEAWLKFTGFKDWALQHGYHDNLSIERVDVNGNYCPTNCKWIPWEDQQKNTSRTVRYTLDGVTKILEDWLCDPRCHTSARAVKKRLSLGWPFEKALLQEPRSHRV